MDALEVAGKARERAIHKLVHDTSEAVAVGIVLIPGVVAAGCLELVDLFGPKAEDLDVLVAHELADLDVCAVVGAEGEGAVVHELHVRRAGGLGACRGDLLGDIGCRIDELGIRDSEVRDEGDLDRLVHMVVVVDHVGDGVDEADDFLCEVIALGSLAGEDEGCRLRLEGRICEETVVDVEDLEDVQELALVGMEALDLDIEDRGRIELDARRVLDVAGKALLLRLLGSMDILQERLVLLIRDELLELIGILEPAIADCIGDELCIGRVGLCEEAAVSR